MVVQCDRGCRGLEGLYKGLLLSVLHALQSNSYYLGLPFYYHRDYYLITGAEVKSCKKTKKSEKNR